MKTSSLKCKDQTLVGFVYASILIKYVFKVLSILIIFVYCCKYDIYDFTFSRWRILLAEPPYSKNISCYFNRGIDSVKITALSNHKPGILNNYIRIIFFSENWRTCNRRSVTWYFKWSRCQQECSSWYRRILTGQYFICSP